MLKVFRMALGLTVGIGLIAAARAGCLDSVELASGVVYAGTGGAIYLTTPDGGVQAVNSRDGKRLWSSASTAKPLLVKGRTLIVQTPPGPGGALRLPALDTGNGHALWTTEARLPAGAVAMIDEGLGMGFSLQARCGNGDIGLAWRYHYTAITGMPQRSPPQSTRLQGVMGLDLSARRARSLDSGTAKFDSAPVRGSALPGGGTRMTSVDGNHFLISSREKTGSGTWDKYRWRVFAVATEKSIGEIRYHVAVEPFLVSGSRLFHVSQPFGRRVKGQWVDQPRRLRAVDLGGGKEVWALPLYDTTYRGGYPPGKMPGGMPTPPA